MDHLSGNALIILMDFVKNLNASDIKTVKAALVIILVDGANNLIKEL